MRRVRTAALVAVAALALASCGIGAVDRAELEQEAQARGGGVTAALAADALAAVGERDGRHPLPLVSLTIELAAVVVVVASPDGTAAESWRYGTSGVLGGDGLRGPTRTGAPPGSPFTAEEAGLSGLDEAVAEARRVTGRDDAWVDVVTVRRPERRPPVTTVLLVDRAGQEEVVLGPDGELAEDGPR